MGTNALAGLSCMAPKGLIMLSIINKTSFLNEDDHFILELNVVFIVPGIITFVVDRGAVAWALCIRHNVLPSAAVAEAPFVVNLFSFHNMDRLRDRLRQAL